MKKGFTFIELIMVVGVVAVVASIGFSNLINNTKQQRVVQTAENLRQSFLQAKSYSQAGKKDCTACGSTTPDCGNGDVPVLGWRVSVNNTTTPQSYETHGECAPVALPTPTIYFTSGNKVIPEDVTISATGGRSILFSPINGNTNLTAATTFTVSSTTAGLTSRSFTIRVNGEVSNITTP